MRQATIKYSLPQTTLSDHLTGKSTKRYGGAPTVLSPEEEHEIVITCHVLADMGFPLNKDYVSLIIRDYVNEKYQENPFGSNGIPGSRWWECFLPRWPNLRERKPQHISKH